MDLSKLSDQELEALASGKPSSAPAAKGLAIEDLNDDELEQLAGGAHLEDPSILSKIGKGIGEGVAAAGNFVDSYTGAPARAALKADQNDESMLGAFVNQFGKDNKLAPTGPEVARGYGVQGETLVMPAQNRQAFDEKFNPGFAGAMKKAGKPYQDLVGDPSAAVGLGIDIAADPTNLLPIGLAVKGTFQGLGKTAGLLGRGIKAVGGAATDAARTSKAGNAVVETAKATKSALENVFRPKQSKDFSRWIEVAQKNGIDPAALPESIEFGPGSVISRGARTVREGPIGEDAMAAFQDGLMQVDSAVDQNIARIGGGLPLNDVEAGDLIRQGYDDAVEQLFKNVDVTYQSVLNRAPGIVLDPPSLKKLNAKILEIDEYANNLLREGITKSEKEQAKQLLRAVEGLKYRLGPDPKSGTFGSLKQLYSAMSTIGRHAFKTGKAGLADTPVDIEKFRDLYFTMREGFLDSTNSQLGGTVANNLIESNETITNFLKNKEPIGKILSNKQLAPEKLFKSLISSGDTTRIRALKEMLSPEHFNQLKGSYLEGLITRNSDETINFGALRTRLQKNRGILSVLFEPQEISDFAELVLLGEKFGPAVLSTSGTGGSGLFRDMLEGIKSGATNRTTLDYMKGSARGRSLPQSTSSATPQLAGRKSMSFPRRTSPEEVSKYLQITAAQEGASNKEKEAAAQRRLETIKRLRGAGQ
jgi:hypothetical protein